VSQRFVVGGLGAGQGKESEKERGEKIILTEQPPKKTKVPRDRKMEIYVSGNEKK
jgi:hypothetical protein